MFFVSKVDTEKDDYRTVIVDDVNSVNISVNVIDSVNDVVSVSGNVVEGY